MSRHLSVRLCPEIIFRQTLWIIAALVGASLLAAFFGIELGHDRLLGLSNLVHLDQERNLPTLFSSVQLVVAGSLAWFLGRKEPVALSRGLWRLLGAGLCFMALDETAGIHELVAELDLGLGRETPFLRALAWVLPAIAVVTLFGAVLLRLLLTLPRRTAAMLFLSGGVFLSGCMGMEMVGMPHYKPRGSEDWTYTICYTLEETLEMLGPALFIRTALRYAVTKQNEEVHSDGVTSASGQR